MINWLKGFFPLMIMMAIIASPCYAERPSWAIDYPYTFEIQDGSYAWLVTPGRAEKVSQLVFEWSEDTQVLKVNGDRVLPPVEVAPKTFSEADYERIYKRVPIIAEWAKEIGSWKKAWEQYDEYLNSFKKELEKKHRLIMEGTIVKKDLDEYFKNACQRYPLSRMIAREKGIKIFESHSEFYLIWYPEGEVCPDMAGIRQKEDYKMMECSKEQADAMVRRIISFYKTTPHLEHLVFIGNGGPSHLIMGADSVAKVNREILGALNEKKLPEGPSILSSYMLENMMENTEVDHD